MTRYLSWDARAIAQWNAEIRRSRESYRREPFALTKLLWGAP